MNTVTWLHISDLHYCKPKTGWDANEILEKLLDDLRDMEKQFGLEPDLIFFTGDLAYGNVEDKVGLNLQDQYRGVHVFLEKIRTTFIKEIPKENIFLVPGNHDVNRNLVTKQITQWLDYLENEEEITKMIKECEQGWKNCI